MARLSIEVSDTDHKKLKAAAAVEGVSIKDFVLSRTIDSDDRNWQNLSNFLAPRIKEAKEGNFSTRSFDQIIEAAKKES
jgi:hypothetical protein